ncbi:agamous-like MADS-box protein AGL11 [Pyrus communis]|uniref:agamous-like MADS-box protein AGL11 n=1 Tax=Pyrus communis TaxID=23211 RepID=UPI0035C1B5DF
MGRSKSKLPLELIPNERSRKVTFRKRRNGLLKKAVELHTLCDVKVCTIVYERKSKGKVSRLATFPEEFKDVKEIIDKYKSNSSKVKKVQSLGDFYATQTVQVKEEFGKLRSKSCEEKYPAWEDRLDAFSVEQMLDLLTNLENKIVDAHKMHGMMKESKQIVVQETIPPKEEIVVNIQILLKATFESNQEYSQMQSASTFWANNNIQYTCSSATTSNSNIKTSTCDIPAPYGNMDGNSTFYNPMQQQQQPCMYDSIFSSAASQQQEEAVVPSVENPNPIGIVPLSVSYDQPMLSLTMQPSYLEYPISASAFGLSSKYEQQFGAFQSQHMFYDNVFFDNMAHFE